MYPSAFDYVRVGSVAEAIDELTKSDAKLLAGGHSLLPVMKLRLADPATLIDIGRIDAIQGIDNNGGDVFHIGALTTHTEVADQTNDTFPAALREAAGMIGDPQVRNRGTVGGNVAHADPASDLPTVFAALGATIHVTGPDGSRTIAAADFFTGLFETALADNEILTAVDVNTETTGTGSAYAKLFNPASRYAMVGACATIEIDKQGKCSACTVAVGGLTSHATIVPAVGAALTGNTITDETIAAAADLALADIGDDINGDMHASANYRSRMLPVFVARALTTANSRAS